ncbi:DUF4190 domain-containing protein [Streptomyces sp. NPDC059582]|uniref:DUF4190 domain-containing protein n=1 Tax=Streptomyces sp. NPDC059582 TaxID=3346875 RepID=UPI0036A9FDF3
MSIPPPPGTPDPQQPQGPYQAPPSAPYGQPAPYGQSAPYGPYGPPPYQTWGQGYSPFNRPAPVNGLAIASLVLGIFCFLPAMGLVLGVIALVQIRKRGGRGRGLAVGGAVLSSIGLVLWTLMLTTGAASEFWEGVKEGARDGTSLSVSAGECFDAPDGALEGYTYDVDKVPCEGEHDGEVFAVFELRSGTDYPDDSYPGDTHVTDIADDKCYKLRDDYAMDAWAVPEDVDVYYFTPTEDSWSIGDREITCAFGNTDEHATLTGSLRNDATMLDADQLAFLKASRALDATLAEEPVDYAEEDLEANTDWAGDVDAALGEQAGALRGRTWPSPAAKPVAAFVKDMEAARKEWAKAASADDADAFYEHYDKGYAVVDGDSAVTAREALGLATTPPSVDDYGDGSGDSKGSGDLDV